MNRYERLADNERKIREANEEAELVAADEARRERERRTAEIEFLCACGRAECDETLLLTIGEYEDVHRRPHRFIVAPGHETPAVERVIETHAAYLVVEKRAEYQSD